MASKDIARELAIEDRLFAPPDRDLDQSLVFSALQNFRVSDQFITSYDGLQKPGLGSTQNDIRVVYCEHRRIIRQAKDESSVDQPTVVSHHLLRGLEANLRKTLSDLARRSTEARVNLRVCSDFHTFSSRAAHDRWHQDYLTLQLSVDELLEHWRADDLLQDAARR
jgi:hypothetical protein